MPLRLVPQRARKLHGLFQAGEKRELCRGEAVYACGEPGEQIWVVHIGHVRLNLPTTRGGEGRVVALAGPGEIFGEEALFPGGRRRYGAVAGESCRLSGADGARVLQVLRRTRHTLPLLFEAAVLDLARSRWAPPGTAGPRTAERLADLLLELSTRFGSEGEGDP